MNLLSRIRLPLGAVSALIAAAIMDGAAPQRSNIVFIMADDLGHGDVSCYGRPDFKTPKRPS